MVNWHPEKRVTIWHPNWKVQVDIPESNIPWFFPTRFGTTTAPLGHAGTKIWWPPCLVWTWKNSPWWALKGTIDHELRVHNFQVQLAPANEMHSTNRIKVGVALFMKIDETCCKPTDHQLGTYHEEKTTTFTFECAMWGPICGCGGLEQWLLLSLVWTGHAIGDVITCWYFGSLGVPNSKLSKSFTFHALHLQLQGLSKLILQLWA